MSPIAATRTVKGDGPLRIGNGPETFQRMQVFCAMGYPITTHGIAARARTAAVYKAQRFSDHAPLTVDCDW